VNDERIVFVGEAAGGRLIAGVLELADEDLEAQGAVLDSGRLVFRRR
jgi:acetyl esterase/lipase